MAPPDGPACQSTGKTSFTMHNGRQESQQATQDASQPDALASFTSKRILDPDKICMLIATSCTFVYIQYRTNVTPWHA